MKGFLLAFCFLTFSLGVAWPAGAIVIDFSPSFGAPETGYVLLTDQLNADYGVRFSTPDPDGVIWIGAESDPNLLRYSYTIAVGKYRNPIDEDSLGPIYIEFHPHIYAASITAFDGGGDHDILTLQAFGPNNAVVDLSAVDFPLQDETPRIANVSAAEIAYLVLNVDIADPNIEFGHGLFFDDLTFEQILVGAPIPEPSTMLLLASGIGLIRIAGGRRRKMPKKAGDQLLSRT